MAPSVVFSHPVIQEPGLPKHPHFFAQFFQKRLELAQLGFEIAYRLIIDHSCMPLGSRRPSGDHRIGGSLPG